MIFTKGAHHSAKFQTFDCSGELPPNLYFDRLLSLKVYKVSAKKSVEDLRLMIPKNHSVHLRAFNQIFKKRGLGKTSTFREELLGKRGLAFFRGDCNFHIKNKLKSEIFNDKKSL